MADLKKTFAVLIESILGRLSRIESVLNRTGLDTLLQRAADNGTTLHAEGEHFFFAPFSRSDFLELQLLLL